MQWNQTDWEFLSSLAAEIGHEMVVVDGKLHLREPGESSDGPGRRRPAHADNDRQLVAGGNLLRLRATVSGAEQVEEVQVRGWDYKAKEAVAGTAKAERHVAQRFGRASARPTLADALERRHAGQGRPADRQRRGGAGRRRLARRAARQRGGRARRRRPRATRRCAPASR